jgi:hypothetical protein
MSQPYAASRAGASVFVEKSPQHTAIILAEYVRLRDSFATQRRRQFSPDASSCSGLFCRRGGLVDLFRLTSALLIVPNVAEVVPILVLILVIIVVGTVLVKIFLALALHIAFTRVRLASFSMVGASTLAKHAKARTGDSLEQA